MSLRHNMNGRGVWPATCLLLAAGALAQIGWAPITGGGVPTITTVLSEGEQPYTPTRLEWISLKANATLSKNVWKSEGYAVFFATGGSGSDTIRIIGMYHPERSNRVTVNKEVEFARQSLDALAKQKGWDGWLKIVEQVDAKG